LAAIKHPTPFEGGLGALGLVSKVGHMPCECLPLNPKPSTSPEKKSISPGTRGQPQTLDFDEQPHSGFPRLEGVGLRVRVPNAQRQSVGNPMEIGSRESSWRLEKPSTFERTLARAACEVTPF
jgi:hypothetical protein